MKKILSLVLALGLCLSSMAFAADKLVVGTSADYPPYEFMDKNGDFTGFDMDLVRAIGEKMGKKIKIVDMGFDTLIAALQKKKIDVVIAAMQATPERAEKVDFSIVYRTISDALLVKEGSDIQLKSIFDSAPYKVGGQTGTIQEKWVQDNLIKTGKLPKENYFSYERVDNAAMDLRAGRIDILHIQSDPARELMKKKGLKIALISEEAIAGGQSLAVTKGNKELLDAINKAIEEIKADGTMKKLMDKYELL